MKIFKGLVLGLALLLAVPASAATISDARFSNNQTSIDAVGGATVTGTFTLTVGAGEVVEFFRFMPNGSPFTEVSVGGTLGYQEGVYTNVPFTGKVQPNTGTINFDVQGAGIFGGGRSINGGDNVVVWPTNVGQVRVVATGPTSTESPVVGSEGWMAALIAAIKATLMPTPAPTPVPTPVSTLCSQLATAMVGSQYGVRNSANVRLQGFLLYQGEAIPALAAGASFGLFLNQTQAALDNFKSTRNCQ